jgi:hypothetical protein
MSFDIYLARMQAGDGTDFDASVVSNINTILTKYSLKPNEYGSLELMTDDGGLVIEQSEINVGNKALSIKLFGLGNLQVQFIFDLATAGDLTIWNMQGADTEECPSMIPISKSQQEECLPLLGVYSCVPLATSAKEMSAMLIGSVEAWQNYRQQVIDRN